MTAPDAPTRGKHALPHVHEWSAPKRERFFWLRDGERPRLYRSCDCGEMKYEAEDARS